MLCCTSVLSSVLRSAALGLRRAGAVLQISALVPSWDLGELFYAVLYISAVICAQIYGPGLRRAALCCAADLCSSWALGELLYAVLHICAVSVL